jgi:hypothetical protein
MQSGTGMLASKEYRMLFVFPGVLLCRKHTEYTEVENAIQGYIITHCEVPPDFNHLVTWLLNLHN